MSKISILSEKVANQVAAGEVIEKPASIVKELIENSLDAKSKNIEITIENGSCSLIIIQDDGEGMSEQDAVLSLSRHSTSKIRNICDLENILSYGFRGEALSSIAAVSDMRLVTKTKNSESATEVIIKAGKICHIGECAAIKGTRIEVRDLFYNVPARKEFQREKSVAFDVGEVHKVVTSLALANPMIKFKLLNQNNLLF